MTTKFTFPMIGKTVRSIPAQMSVPVEFTGTVIDSGQHVAFGSWVLVRYTNAYGQSVARQLFEGECAIL